MEDEKVSKIKIQTRAVAYSSSLHRVRRCLKAKQAHLVYGRLVQDTITVIQFCAV